MDNRISQMGCVTRVAIGFVVAGPRTDVPFGTGKKILANQGIHFGSLVKETGLLTKEVGHAIQ